MSFSNILSALGDETCRKILSVLKDRRINSGELATALNVTPQALSYHLSKLKKADLIYEVRVKNFIYYEPNLTVLEEVIVWLKDLKGDHRGE